MKKVKIAIVGFGNIGSFLFNELKDKSKDIEIKTGKKISVVAISAKNINKKRKYKINKKIFFKNPLDIFKKEKIIDATKNWLLLFGAGTVKLEVNGELKTFVSKRNIRLKYKDGELSKISVKEFKSLNKGRKW